ncbi:hypothetical protein Dsin_006502 [Dipteronia sinensis]|uniref:Thaumatin-like protein n=1 Tax=Dipteronia sinensis TaxID=43782 RepID=A0AAE0AZD1_9ROSI|nr:hypothetical protein Dsin_006502 [Dipteronia sinensis]
MRVRLLHSQNKMEECLLQHRRQRLDASAAGAHLTTITVTNNCPYPIWPVTLTGSGAQLSTTGFELAYKATKSLDVAAPWSGSFWARAQCAADRSGKFICNIADCGSGQVECNQKGPTPPASLVEFTIAPNSGQDFYYLSLIDGFNLPLSVTPQGGSGPNCTASNCKGNVNSVCPPELAVLDYEGKVIACKSACLALNQPQYCCTGEYGTPDKCSPTKYSMIFKNQCPQAYSYAYDDKSSTFTCTGGANYVITFCP